MHSIAGLPRPAPSEQEIFDTVCGQTTRLILPAPGSEVLPGIKWGLAGCPFTPAFWAAQAWFERDLDMTTQFRWGSTLVEEIVGCLLGGHGITWEMNLAAFGRRSAAGLLRSKPVLADLVIQLLSQPLDVKGRFIRYRFPRQKGLFVSEAINRVATERVPTETPLILRDWLISFRGIGPKTASWITRNFFNFARVAIIDIHLYRACVLMGLFSGNEDITRNYRALEARYLALGDALNVDLLRLDAVIWKTMRDAGRFATNMLRAAA